MWKRRKVEKMQKDLRGKGQERESRAGQKREKSYIHHMFLWKPCLIYFQLKTCRHKLRGLIVCESIIFIVGSKKKPWDIQNCHSKQDKFIGFFNVFSCLFFCCHLSLLYPHQLDSDIMEDIKPCHGGRHK